MTGTFRDIENKKDIEIVVNQFYDKVKIDPLLGGLFGHVNWESHLPVMYSFWHSLVFETYAYKGNPFEKHAKLPVTTNHFDRWLTLFCETVDHNFSGQVAEKMKKHASQIARVFQYKMELIPINS